MFLQICLSIWSYSPRGISEFFFNDAEVSKIPGNISKRFQETAEGPQQCYGGPEEIFSATAVAGVEKTVTGIIELPDRLSKGGIHH